VFRGEGGFGRFQAIGRGVRRMVSPAVEHGDRDLPILHEAPFMAAWAESIGLAGWRCGGRAFRFLAAGRAEEAKRATHLRLDVLHMGRLARWRGVARQGQEVLGLVRQFRVFRHDSSPAPIIRR
jgi:hypothetical protein